MIRKLIAGAFLALACLGPAQAKKTYTVDDLLALEQFGRVRFDLTGRTLVFERFGAYDQQGDYSRPWTVGGFRSKILKFEVDGASPPTPLFPQKDGDGYHLLGLSPSGRLVSFEHLSPKALAPGLASFTNGKTVEADITPGAPTGRDSIWWGDDLIFPALSADRRQDFLSIQAELVDELVAKWGDTRRGDKPTSGVIGSGRFAPEAGHVGRLMTFGVTQGARPLAEGEYNVTLVSPDEKWVAALRTDFLQVAPDQRLEHGANIGAVQRSLWILPRPGAEPFEVCQGCDVLSTSVNWSPSGRRLSFVARPPGRDWSDAIYYILDLQTRRLSEADLGRFAPHHARAGLQLSISSAWVGEELAVLVDRPSPDAVRGRRNNRADWVLLSQYGARSLTADLAGGTPELVNVAADGLVLLQDGRAWLARRSGLVRLASETPERLSAWSQPGDYGAQPPLDRQPEKVATFVVKDAAGTPVRFLFIDLQSRRVSMVKAPEGARAVVAANWPARRLAVLVDDQNATKLVVVDANQRLIDVTEINTHLRSVNTASRVRIDHRGPGGDLRHSWLLLPPDAKPGQTFPTIVNVYPGSVLGEVFTRWRPDTMNPLNDEVLVAQGYAVLYPSIPINYEEVPRDPLNGLPEEVFAAVDAAVAEGHVDAKRLAVQGQSYGGYAVGGLIGMTDRFKTAIAQAGLYNLISSYGQFDTRRRFQFEKEGLDLFAVSLLETHQGGMGAPPWRDPERYLRNSPLMHVEQVRTPVMLMTGDSDYVSTTQAEEFFTALVRLGKDAKFVRYYGEDHVYRSPANIRDMWARIIRWYDETLK